MRLCYVSSELREGIIDKGWWETACWPLEAVLRKMSELKIRDVELSPPHITADTSPKELAKVRSLLNTYDISPAGIDSTAFLWTVNNADVKQVFKLIALAHKLETGFVKIFSAPVKSASMRRTVELLTKSERAEASGVRLGVENIWDHHFGKIPLMRKGLEAVGSESIAPLVDVTNYYVGGDDPIDAVKALAGRAVQVHVKDAVKVDGRSAWRVLGRGDLSTHDMYPKIIVELKGTGYDGCLSIEPHVFPALDALEESVSFLRPLVG